MTLVLEIEKGHSANCVMIGNVVKHICLDKDKGLYMVTYKDPNRNNELFDIVIKHVINIEEVKSA